MNSPKKNTVIINNTINELTATNKVNFTTFLESKATWSMAMLVDPLSSKIFTPYVKSFSNFIILNQFL